MSSNSPAPSPAARTADGGPAVIEALAWVHVRDGRLLCVRPEGKDLLYVPGGKREPGESDEEAVTRETLEEVSVALRPGTFQRVAAIDQEAHDQAPGTRVRLLCYGAEHDGEIVPDNEILETVWISYAERDLCAPAVRDLVEVLHERGELP
ncbi:DNA mismatch repair protein MutT [Nocardiopsis terrae]|uniref:ADP-ribose pyrophosphatase YjhB (NUDIX family) n=1 Tax=Nocardiopsis terrae TaxID=372655 RepID=A0ABR9HB18_9ACTN|nr:NUDIX domain-containing protein [Nocardiopsis terrae]MBE1456214.1 ADP-ribose pyrophosphatase YjhB (NUDIX family) [Nocardiopsis terrae]GHC78142.1 DNA mismatch repair protein MutT [Nocardiopsis terrae]